MNRIKQWWLAAAGVGVLVTVIGAGAVMAQTPSTSPTQPGPSTRGTPAASGTPGAGAFKSNEDATHEGTESAAQEAAEDSGMGRGGKHGGASNEDAAHEATEPAAREAAENARATASTPAAGATQPAN